MKQQECLLKQVEEQEKTAKKFGFYWSHISQLIEQIQSECIEVQEAWEKGDLTHLQEEVGDLLQAATSLVIFCGFDPHETLHNGIEKFQKRYDKLVQLVEKDGLDNLQSAPFEQLMSYWRRAKQI